MIILPTFELSLYHSSVSKNCKITWMLLLCNVNDPFDSEISSSKLVVWLNKIDHRNRRCFPFSIHVLNFDFNVNIFQIAHIQLLSRSSLGLIMFELHHQSYSFSWLHQILINQGELWHKDERISFKQNIWEKISTEHSNYPVQIHIDI